MTTGNTPLAKALTQVGWSCIELSERLGVSRSAVFSWHRGMNSRGNPCSAPADVLVYLENVSTAIGSVAVPVRGS